MRQVDVGALAAALAVLFGATAFLFGVGHMLVPDWGGLPLEIAASVYPGYQGPAGFGSVIVVTLYAALDGAVAGAVLAWLYNTVSRGRADSSA